MAVQQKIAREPSLDMMKVFAAFCIVMVHSDNLFREYGTGMPRFLVPFGAIANTGNALFMIIAGYLLFVKNEPWAVNLKKKVKTLLVPMILWNLIWIAAEALGHHFMPVRFDDVLSWSPADWLVSLFGVPFFKDPYYMPFWFLVDLFALNILSPLIRILCEKLPVLSGIAAAVLWFLPLVYRIRIPFVFFTAGCLLALYPDLSRKGKQLPAAVVYALAAAGVVLACVRYDDLTIKATVLMFLPAAARLCAAFAEKDTGRKIMRLCLPHLIVIYAVHGKVLMVLQQVWTRLVPLSSAALCAGYFVLPAVTVTGCLIFGWCLRKLFPHLSGWLTGGR